MVLSESAATTAGCDMSSSGRLLPAASPGSDPTIVTTSSVSRPGRSASTRARFAPTASVNCSARNVPAVAKSGASARTDSSSARPSPVSGDGASNCTTSRVELLKPPFQIRILLLHPLELRFRSGANALARARDRRGDADGFGILQVRIDRCDDDPRLDGDQVDPDERDTYPGVDDDTLVADAIEDVDELTAPRWPFNCHL